MKRSGRILLVTAVLVALVVVIVGSLYMPGVTSSVPASANAGSTNTTLEILGQSTPPASLFTQIYNEVSPSVVAIRVTTVSRNRVLSSGTGSGFVLDQAGHIVTNNHVVEGVSQIEVDFYDGTLAWATIVGTDPNSDLAVLQVDLPASELNPVVFGDSDALQVGAMVLAIGSPFGQDWTLTSGIISGLDRTLQGLTDFSIGGVIQTDAAINPGSSGGPLLDLEGHVIGVNSQIMSTSNSSSGVGFAVPSNLTRLVAQELIDHGKSDYSYIGISGTDVTLTLNDALGLPNTTRGIAVSDVVQNGPAAAAGLRSAGNVRLVNGEAVPSTVDIITAIDGHPLKSMGDLISYLARATTPGQTVRLTVLRDGGQSIDLTVTLVSRPQ